jgi:hypothetical protein
MNVCELLGSLFNVAQTARVAKRWRRSRDRGLPVLWLATAQNLTLTAEGRAAGQARACGTLARLAGEQAAAGQTARQAMASGTLAPLSGSLAAMGRAAPRATQKAWTASFTDLRARQNAWHLDLPSLASRAANLACNPANLAREHLRAARRAKRLVHEAWMAARRARSLARKAKSLARKAQRLASKAIFLGAEEYSLAHASACIWGRPNAGVKGRQTA